MQQLKEFQRQKIDPDKIVYTLGEGRERFSATIMLNANDSMDFAQITQLPESRDQRIEALKAFRELFHTQYGAKTFTKVGAEYFGDCVEAGFNPKPFIGPANRELKNGLVISRESLDQAVAKFDNVQKPGLRLVQNHDLLGRGAELFEFKRANADFVTTAKIEGGLYSADAEEKKLLNSNNLVFALLDENNVIMATLMLTVHGSWAYGADFIVDKAHQKSGIGKYLCLASHQLLAKDLPITNVWLIGGGHEEDNLYGQLFGAQPINESTQQNEGIFLFFTQPGSELKAAIAEKADQRYDLSSAAHSARIGFLAAPKSEVVFKDNDSSVSAQRSFN